MMKFDNVLERNTFLIGLRKIKADMYTHMEDHHIMKEKINKELMVCIKIIFFVTFYQNFEKRFTNYKMLTYKFMN